MKQTPVLMMIDGASIPQQRQDDVGQMPKHGSRMKRDGSADVAEAAANEGAASRLPGRTESCV